MDTEDQMELTRELLTAMTAGVLNAMKLVDKDEKTKIDILFSPQVFNPNYRGKKRRTTFVINACITPPGEEGNHD